LIVPPSEQSALMVVFGLKAAEIDQQCRNVGDKGLAVRSRGVGQVHGVLDRQRILLAAEVDARARAVRDDDAAIGVAGDHGLAGGDHREGQLAQDRVGAGLLLVIIPKSLADARDRRAGGRLCEGRASAGERQRCDDAQEGGGSRPPRLRGPVEAGIQRLHEDSPPLQSPPHDECSQAGCTSDRLPSGAPVT
jgi:hypothetical protein